MMAAGEVTDAVALMRATLSGVEKQWRTFVPEAREALTAIQRAGWRLDPPVEFVPQTPNTTATGNA